MRVGEGAGLIGAYIYRLSGLGPAYSHSLPLRDGCSATLYRWLGDVHYFAAVVFVTLVDVAGVDAPPRVYRVEGVTIVGVDRIAASATVDYVLVARANCRVYVVGTPHAVYHVGHPEGGALVDYIAVVGAVSGQIGTRKDACQSRGSENPDQQRHQRTHDHYLAHLYFSPFLCEER